MKEKLKLNMPIRKQQNTIRTSHQVIACISKIRSTPL